MLITYTGLSVLKHAAKPAKIILRANFTALTVKANVAFVLFALLLPCLLFLDVATVLMALMLALLLAKKASKSALLVKADAKPCNSNK